jgi:formylmethanofuran dehydrogenase subunit C
MTLFLTVRTPPPGRVDASVLTPERVRGRSAREVSAMTVSCGRLALPLGELFDVTGTGSDHLFVAGDLRSIDRIGNGMATGQLVIDGSCGDHLGAGMSGGEIFVDGDVGAWAGAEMRGGYLTIRGSAGDRLGGAYPGARAGMSGGEIVITGDAGEEAGACLRRGLVAIGGRADAGAGLRMLAGTVIALGGVGAEAGMGNKRGSIVSGAPVRPLPSYTFAVRYAPPALLLQLRQLRRRYVPVDDAFLTGRWARWSGDRTELGRGEMLIFDQEEGLAG